MIMRLNPMILRRVKLKQVNAEFEDSLKHTERMFYGEYKNGTTLAQFKNVVISMTIDGIHWEMMSKTPENSEWYDEVFNSLSSYYNDIIEKKYKQLNNKKTSKLKESLESKWNEGNYDYQYGYCHYFAYDIIGKIKKRFPNKKVNYYLQLAQEIDKYDGTVVQDYLIHVYIKIDDILLDSNGLTTKREASKRAEEWEQRQAYLVPETYETVVWEEESDEIPEIFFNNKFCNTGRVKKDVETFLSNPIVKRILRDK